MGELGSVSRATGRVVGIAVCVLIVGATASVKADPFDGRFEGYSVTSIDPTLIALSAPTPISLPDDEMTEQLELNFSTRLFDGFAAQFWVGSNGFVSMFRKEAHGCCEGPVLPSASDPNGLIAGFWTDLDPAAGGNISFQRFAALALPGLAPQAAIVVSYDAVPGPGPTTNTFQIVLLAQGAYEIRIREASVPAGVHATIGLESFNGATAHTIQRVEGVTLRDVAWRATPVYRPYLPDLVIELVEVTPPASPNVPWRVAVHVANADIGPIEQATVRVSAMPAEGALRGTSPGCSAFVGQKPVFDLGEAERVVMTFAWSPPVDANDLTALRVGDFTFTAEGVVVAAAKAEVALGNNVLSGRGSYLAEAYGGTDVLCQAAPEVGA